MNVLLAGDNLVLRVPGTRNLQSDIQIFLPRQSQHDIYFYIIYYFQHCYISWRKYCIINVFYFPFLTDFSCFSLNLKIEETACCWQLICHCLSLFPTLQMYDPYPCTVILASSNKGFSYLESVFWRFLCCNQQLQIFT